MEWISVNEKMPEDGERVLTLHSDFVVRIGKVEKGKLHGVFPMGAKGQTTVICWMPLPEPPDWLIFNGKEKT